MPTALIFPARSETEQKQLESQIQDLVDYSGSYGHRVTSNPIDSLWASNMRYEIDFMLTVIVFVTCSLVIWLVGFVLSLHI